MSGHLIWGLCVVMALPCGGLGWEVIRLRYFKPEPAIVPVKIVKYAPVDLTHANIFSEAECRRTCRARMKSAEVKAR